MARSQTQTPTQRARSLASSLAARPHHLAAPLPSAEGLAFVDEVQRLNSEGARVPLPEVHKILRADYGYTGCLQTLRTQLRKRYGKGWWQ